MTEEIKYPDQRSKRFIFVPFCLICQAFQAKGIVRFGFSSVIRPVLDELLKHDLNIVQMPCSESRFGGYEKGLQRQPKSIEEYNKSEFLAICDNAAEETAQMIKAIIANGFEVVGILGLEYSPSCSVSLQYSHRGTTHQPGHFIAALQRKLEVANIKIPFVGINRRGINASIERIRKLVAPSLFQ